MHLPSLIERKREGLPLSDAEIHHLIAAFTAGEMPDSQMAALAMAIFFRGMTTQETSALTHAMLHSGITLAWPADAPPRVDKHSTGGIGDKTSLILAPLLATDGLWVPMISGRGLGITGGTLDKLESIPGFSTQLPTERVLPILSAIGCVMIGQTADLCPADKKLYALRDVTGTVPSIPLITASIMSKKLAEGLTRLVLDVKFGSGAFMKTRDQAITLADSMVRVGQSLGVETTALLHPMDQPTGHAAGNALEVAECVQCLQGRGPADLETLVLDLAAPLTSTPRATLRQHLLDGTAWDRFQHMVQAQGGDPSTLETLTTRTHPAPVIVELRADRTGTLTRMDAGILGQTILELGAGRAQSTDPIDPAVGLDHIAKTGTSVSPGDTLLRIHARTPAAAESARTQLQSAIHVS
jgi:pyrimidine-nucleoside phosphorylase